MKSAIHYVFLKSLLLPFIAMAVTVNAQHKISGIVKDDKNLPVRGANVYLDNTIDGGTTDSLGAFLFTTGEKGDQTIIVTEVSHETAGQPIVISGDVSNIQLRMKNMAHDLEAVVITAGSFSASDRNKTILKPLDIVTTAGANADVVKAIETLPGTQQTGTDNGLFVRGGDASELSILVDEMVVQNAFFSGPPGVATRSRFGAFQYQGVSFSSGGYSARYGQALSGVLELTTTDMPDKSTVNLGINLAGVYASATKRWKRSSLEFGGSYNNLTPFYGLATTNIKFYDPPIGYSGNVRYVWKPNKDGILKLSMNGSYTTSGIAVHNPYAGIIDTGSNKNNPFAGLPDTINFKTRDQYYYSNLSYKQLFKDKYSLYAAASYSLDSTRNLFDIIPINEKDQRSQFRIEGKDYLTNRLNLLVGGEVQNYSISKEFDTLRQHYKETQISGYAELEWTPINRVAIRPGLRYEHSTVLHKDNLAPRISMAIQTGSYSSISLASGIFYQNPEDIYLLAGYRDLGQQEAIHYIANWQYTKNDRTLRIEGYYKKYQHLVLENYTGSYDPNAYRTLAPGSINVNNNGYGYAQGLELFYRDKKTVKNLDYWISYSYIDTKRKYENFPYEVTPNYIASHNLNLVAKYFVEKWQTNFSATYSFASGRPYYNPNYPAVSSSNFLTDRTPDYNNLALTVAYLHTFGKWFTVFYFSIDNITNQHNIFGYRYTYESNGMVAPNTAPNPILPALYRSFFAGVNFSLTQFKKDEL